MTLPKSFTAISEEFFQFDTMSGSTNLNENQRPANHNSNRQPPMGSNQQQVSLSLNQNPRYFPPTDDFDEESEFETSNMVVPARSLSNTNSPSLTPRNNYAPYDLRDDSMVFSDSSSHFPRDSNTEKIMPGIYLSQNFLIWNEENLRSYGFTHIIIIDKHIQELYYPSPIFQICAQSKANISPDPYEDCTIYENYSSKREALNFGKNFEAIDLNFGEKSYLTTVLPNCYRAVRFIKKAFQNQGKILVIDCNGGEQKCITIVVAYLMYKHNVSFRSAFARLKEHYKKADLDRFYTRQLYEYEPILQVQKAQSRGHSCSRELQAAFLKRKKTVEDDCLADDSESYNQHQLDNDEENLNYIDEKCHSFFPAELSLNRPTPPPLSEESENTKHLDEEFKCFHSLDKYSILDHDDYKQICSKKSPFDFKIRDSSNHGFNNFIDDNMNNFLQKKRAKDKLFNNKYGIKLSADQNTAKEMNPNSLMSYINDYEMC